MYKFNFSQLWPYLPMLIEGLKTTIWLVAVALSIGTLIGLVGAVIRLRAPAPLRWLVQLYIELIRNTPPLVQIYLIFFGLPALGLRFQPFTAGALALSIHAGAYMIEVFRAGLAAVPKGQIEAGRALGLPETSIFFDISLRPALRAMAPALTSEVMMLLLGSSLCGQIAVYELTAAASDIDSRTFRSFEIYLVLGGIYLVLSLLISGLFARAERRLLRWAS